MREGLLIFGDFMFECMLEWVSLEGSYFGGLSVGCIAIDEEDNVLIFEETVFLVMLHKIIE